MENNILKHRMAVMNNIAKSFGYEKSEDLLEKAEDNDIEKAKHQDGDMHPNGKWVWRASANGGKGDWRVAKKGSSSTSGGSGSAGNTGPSNASSSYFSKLSNSLIEKYSKKKESVSLSDIEEFYEDFLRDRGQEPTRKAYANEAKKTYDAIVANWNKKSSNTVTHDINGTKVTVTKNSDGSYTLEANGKKVKSDDPSFFVNGTNLKPRVKAALAKEVGLETKRNNKKKEYSIYGDNGYMSKEFLSYLEENKDVIWPRADWSEYKNVKVHHYGSKDSNYVAITGTNKSGVSVQIDDGYITGEGTGGNHPVRRNATLKFLTEQYKKHGK